MAKNDLNLDFYDRKILFELDKNARITTTDFTAGYKDNELFLDEIYHNDCQTMVIKHYFEVAKLLAWLIEYAPSQMTGTGACIFTCFDTEDEARQLQSKLPKDVHAFVAKGLNRSSVTDAVNSAVAILNS